MAEKESARDAADIIAGVVIVGVVVAVLFPNVVAAAIGGASTSVGAYLLKKAFRK